MAEPFDTIEEYRELDRYSKLDVERLLALSCKFPKCAQLWDFIGDVMQICDEDGYMIADAMNCYNQAIIADPDYAIAHESLGYAYDTYFDDFENAEKHFRRALDLGAGDDVKIGLARVLAQQDRTTEANDLLAACDERDTPKWNSLRDEIEQGVWYKGPAE